MKLILKKQFEETRIGFNGSSKALKDRDDLEVLAEIARRTNNKHLLDMFEEVPVLKDIQKAKGKKIIDELKKADEI